jgi:hypothetical protein
MLLAWVSAWAVDEGIGKHIETIRTGPSLYLTPRAAATPLPPSIMGPYDEVPDGTEAKKVLDATLALSVAGDKAREAVDVLVRRFPRAVHVVMLDDLVYSAGSGSFEDWVLTKTVGVKNRLELDSPFGRYEVIDPCSDFIEVSQEHELHQPSYSGGRLRSAGVTIKMTFVFYAGACALHRITGLDPGTDRRQWVQWLQARPAASATGSSSSPTIVSGQAPPPPAATPAVTAKSSPPAASAPAAAPAAPAPSTSTGLRTEQVSFEQLLERSPVGTRLEVRLVAGSVLVGKLVSVNRAGVRIDVKGASVVPVKREAVRHISLIVYR